MGEVQFLFSPLAMVVVFKIVALLMVISTVFTLLLLELLPNLGKHHITLNLVVQ